MSGSTVIMEVWRNDVAAILLLGYPGQEGGHVFADVLLGHVNPSGKLPYVVPRSADDLPFFDKDATAVTYDLWHGYRKLERDGTQPAFPFGFGLSYTTFELANFRLAQATIGADGALVATLDVTNTGDRAGAEVVQLYVGARSSKVERAPKELKAFNKIELEPGETRTVHLAVPAADLAYYDEADGWTVEPGEYEVIVGRHSLDDQALSTSLAIQFGVAREVRARGAARESNEQCRVGEDIVYRARGQPAAAAADERRLLQARASRLRSGSDSSGAPAGESVDAYAQAL